MKSHTLARIGYLVLMVFMLLIPEYARAAFTYPGCADLKETDFSVDTLVNGLKDDILFNGDDDKMLNEPIKMAFDMDAAGNVDVYFVQRTGRLKRYNALTKKTELLGEIPSMVALNNTRLLPNKTFSNKSESMDEEGLVGIALDPGFKSNRHIFLYYANTENFIVSRFTLSGSSLDLNSEKILLKIPQKKASFHTGGAMQFDPEGNLWITVGDDGEFLPAANTMDLRGKILRIRPTPEGGYTIPNGNLFPNGKASTRPEIYAMGTRNPYSLTLDTLRKGITWGDVGPDQKNATEEHNYTTKPGNFGYPIFAGNNLSLIGVNSTLANPPGGAGTANAPLNNFKDNTGIKELPPAVPAMRSYIQACAVTGPVYYYDPNSPSQVKMPPHFDGSWFISTCSGLWFKAFKLNETTTNLIDSTTVFQKIVDSKNIEGFLLDFQVGPDGAFYVVAYGTWYQYSPKSGLYRIKYNQSCKAPDFKRTWGASIFSKKSLPPGLIKYGNQVEFTLPGAHELILSDLSGRRIARFAGMNPTKYDLSQNAIKGVYLLALTTKSGTVLSKIVFE